MNELDQYKIDHPKCAAVRRASLLSLCSSIFLLLSLWHPSVFQIYHIIVIIVVFRDNFFLSISSCVRIRTYKHRYLNIYSSSPVHDSCTFFVPSLSKGTRESKKSRFKDTLEVCLLIHLHDMTFTRLEKIYLWMKEIEKLECGWNGTETTSTSKEGSGDKWRLSVSFMVVWFVFFI